MSEARTLRCLLGDQLNHFHPWYTDGTPATYLLMEMRQETDYVRHHVQKVIAFFLAMRGFAEHLRQQGHDVIYLRLDDPQNLQDLEKNIRHIISERGFTRFEYQLPDEYRLDIQLKELAGSLPVPTEVFDTHHFITTRNHVAELFKGKKQRLMETFYRQVRAQTGLLMENGEPVGGRWNFDAENRNAYNGTPPVPATPRISRDVTELVAMLEKQGVQTMGKVNARDFPWPVTRDEGLLWLEFFCKDLLPWFGTYQDAMTRTHSTLFHSRLSFLMNAKLLSPMEVVERVVKEWESRPDEVSLSQVEGFVRQIIGWREYMRGIYWERMPDYAYMNCLEHRNPLPSWFWDGNTKMACLRHAITQSLETAYAHHIQRLMLTGNFALLAGTDPAEVDAWYLGIYIDAIEWVQLTNTRGMSQFADGGIVGSKPYVSSANYINKMGDHCRGCHYDPKQRVGDRACPFNSLYWYFHHRHRALLEKNPRIGMVYRTLDRMDAVELKEALSQAERHLANINGL